MNARVVADEVGLAGRDPPISPPTKGAGTGAAFGVETVGLTKRFGAFTALDEVSIKVRPGSFHALLGENGAGKSTLVKCVMGFYRPTAGQLLVREREAEFASPREAHAAGLGMVYQHFTLIPSLTAAENLVIARPSAPAIINWRLERRALDAFMATMPFQAPLDVPVAHLAAGEKQKLEILKQIYLKSRFLILDEPTSVLTPGEADEVLGLLRAMTEAGDLTVLMISHKFREVMAFADEVSILRRGRLAGAGKVADFTRDEMAAAMVGARGVMPVAARIGAPDVARVIMEVRNLVVNGPSGTRAVAIDSLKVHGGEIVGIAGVSGNGQKELAETLGGQRRPVAGEVLVGGSPFGASRAEMRAHKVRYIPEEPLRNACAPGMSVTENLAFRMFDSGKAGRPWVWLRPKAMRANSAALIDAFGVKTASTSAPVATLSGGNVQRAVLARELSGGVDLLIVTNPCFGLDFSAVTEIRSRIIEARNRGAAVLLISEDLDEILELADRVRVISEGRLVYETPAAAADVNIIGRHMAGHH